jgi:1-acyl-sn-glycerol-3-phosphate acyltransferase
MSDEVKFPSNRAHKWLGVLKVLCTPLLFFMGPCFSRNSKAVPRSGGLIVIANHLADTDPLVLQYGCPRAVHFMSKSELWTIPVLGGILRWWGSFAVKRGAPDRSSLRLASELAKDGRAVCIFPEGQLSEDGKLQKIREGAALIIRMAGVPVVCCGLRNTNRMLPYGKLIPRPAFSRVSVTWGEARSFTKESSNEEIVEWMESELRRLIPEPLQ